MLVGICHSKVKNGSGGGGGGFERENAGLWSGLEREMGVSAADLLDASGWHSGRM